MNHVSVYNLPGMTVHVVVPFIPLAKLS